MVLGLKGKNRRSTTIHIDYVVHVQDIKPWPPSQSLRSLRSVLIQWENGDRSSGSTNPVVPSLGSIVGEGRIEFDESFKIPVTLLRDPSAKASDGDVFLKNFLEFNLYEARRDSKTVKGQSLATAILDLAEYGVLKEGLIISVPMNCKRSFKNTDRPVLYIKLQSVNKAARTRSLESGGRESISALMSEEYAEEAELASFTDDDVSSHSSAAASFNGGLHTRNEENGNGTVVSNRKQTMVSKLQTETSTVVRPKTPTLVRPNTSNGHIKRSSNRTTSLDSSLDFGSPQDNHVTSSSSHSPNSSSEKGIKSIDSDGFHSSSSSASVQNENAEEDSNARTGSGCEENLVEQMQESDGESDVTNGTLETEKLGSTGDSQVDGKSEKTEEIGGDLLEEEATTEDKDTRNKEEKMDEKQNLDILSHPREEELHNAPVSENQSLRTSENTPIVERSKHVRSVRADSGRNLAASTNNRTVIKDNLASLGLKERKDVKVFPRDTRSAILESKMQLLEQRIKMLEGELTEAAAVEASLYSVIAEHGSSAVKVHAPARRLSRMYLHSCRESSRSRRANAARSAVSGLVLVAKACGNDVPRLTFWLSNTVVLRTIISQAAAKLDFGPVSARFSVNINTQKAKDKVSSPLTWKISSSGKREVEVLKGVSYDWEDPHTFTCALEKIEAWIFSRIVESIWWQTLTPHMQSVDPNDIVIENDFEPMKNYNRSFSSTGGQEQGNFSLDLWKKAFRDSFDRLCPVRAAGHECGCLRMLSRLVMEQSVSRLDVAMFNAILRDSDDEIPTDPVSDPISDSRVLPIPAGASSFGAGAQLKNAIGNWSRWLTDIFGMDNEGPVEESNDDERQETTFKSFHLLNALSDLMMLPKDMLLSKSIRKEVCPTFDAPLIKRVLDVFSPDEFCPDPIPDVVFEALESEDSTEGEEGTSNFPCNANAIVYSPPYIASVARVIGEIGGQAQLRRSGSSVLRKSYTSDDELDELNSPLALIFNDSPRSSPLSTTKSGWISKEKNNQNAIRYELLRDVWMESQI